MKWQLVGPVTLGLALVRAGVSERIAFTVAERAVCAHVLAVHARIAEALPLARHVVFLDEPMLTDLQDGSFPIAPAAALDCVSSALATIECFGVSGVHCCGDGDWASILSTGPRVLSLPVRSRLVDVAGYLAQFLERDGWVAWGAIDTDGPIPMSAERPAKALSELWCRLVSAGCDPERLVRQSMVTPACGLFTHAEGVATRLFRLVRALSEKVNADATATRLSMS